MSQNKVIPLSQNTPCQILAPPPEFALFCGLFRDYHELQLAANRGLNTLFSEDVKSVSDSRAALLQQSLWKHRCIMKISEGL